MNNWDLKDIFKNQKEIDNLVVELQNKCDTFEQNYKNKLSSLSSQDFLHAMRTYENLSLKLGKIMSYFGLKFASDTNLGAEYAKYDDICKKCEERLLFFDNEILELDNKKIDEFIKFATNYSYYLQNLIKFKPHKLSLAEERVLLLTSSTGQEAFARLFDEHLSNLKFDFENESLTEDEILSKLSDKDRNIRKKAAISLSQTLEKNLRLLSFILNMTRKDLAIQSELRGYKNKEDFRHLSNQISKDSVDALIKASESSYELVSTYYNKKREILGYDELYDYDRYAPIGEDSEINFSDAKEIVLQAFGEFDTRFKEIAKDAFDNNWIDVYPALSKQGGAFSHSCVSEAHPYILLNYTDKRRDLFTLAHELGHSIHQKLSYSVGYLNSHTPLTTAETASVFCEMLVFDYVKKRANDKEKLSLLASKLEDIFATLYRQINFTLFERRIHGLDGELSIDKINEIWMQESVKMFGDSVKLNDYYKIWWSYIPHFIHTPFYCYAYSYAQLLVLALFGLYKSNKFQNFTETYIKFLSLGGSKSPKELVKMFNLDIQSDEFWNIGLLEIKNLLDEFKGIKC